MDVSIEKIKSSLQTIDYLIEELVIDLESHIIDMVEDTYFRLDTAVFTTLRDKLNCPGLLCVIGDMAFIIKKEHDKSFGYIVGVNDINDMISDFKCSSGSDEHLVYQRLNGMIILSDKFEAKHGKEMIDQFMQCHEFVSQENDIEYINFFSADYLEDRASKLIYRR